MIKVATKDDHEVLKQMLNELRGWSIFSFLFKNAEPTDLDLSRYTNPETYTDRICLLATKDSGEVIGFVTLDAFPMFNCGVDTKMARMTFTYIKPAYRKQGYMEELTEGFEYWARKIGASICCIGLVKGKKKGYKRTETIYMKELN